MSDPIKDLENFDHQGLAMNPLTPAEVRRRGNRMRRRNNGVLALGAAAAVAVIATSGVLVSNAVDQGSAPGPAGSTSESPSETATTEDPQGLTEIPADFPLAAGVKGAQRSDEALMAGLEYCGTAPLADLAPVDVRSVELSGGETAIVRTLYLLDSPEAAVTAHEAILDAAAACTTGAPGNDGDVAVHRDGEGWPGSTVTNDHARGEEVFEPAVDVVNAVSAGPALLVTSVAMYPTEGIDQNVATARQDDNAVMVAMAEFGEYDAPDTRGSDTGTSTTAGDIPDGFPLAAGWPEEAEPGGDNGLTGPNRELPALAFQACGEQWQEPAHADRLRADWQNPEDYRGRQLTTYEDADAALAAVADLVAQQQACPADPERDDGYVTEREVRTVDVDGADEAWAILERDTMDGAESPFGATTVLVRVGRSVLVVTHGGHSGYPGGDGTTTVDAMVDDAAPVLDAMTATF